MDTARALLAEIQQHEADPEIEEKQGKLEQLKGVLEMYGHFSGINRKVQMKYQPKGRPRGSSSDDGKNTYSAFIYIHFMSNMCLVKSDVVAKDRFYF